jgi:uncharacterized protein YdhG (YjbR/CyaY superfamily)
MNKPTTVDEYITSAPSRSQDHLIQIRQLLIEIAPHATEAIKWGQPVLEQGRILYSFSAYKNHMNFMPTGQTLSQFKEEISMFKTGQDTIQFEYDKPLPVELIKKLAKHRLNAVLEEDAKWRY